MSKLLLSTTSFQKSLDLATQLIPVSLPGNVYLFTGESPYLSTLIQEIADRFALVGPIRLIVGGNRFSTDHLALLLSGRIDQIYAVLDRIQLSRAETCYQMLHALQHTQAGSEPLIVMDLLQTFYDENLTLGEVKGVLGDCMTQVQRISHASPVVISSARQQDKPQLIEMLWGACDQVLELNLPPESTQGSQPKLF